MPKLDDQPVPLLTLREIAKWLSISERSVKTLTASGELRCLKIGRALRFEKSDVVAFIEGAKLEPIVEPDISSLRLASLAPVPTYMSAGEEALALCRKQNRKRLK